MMSFALRLRPSAGLADLKVRPTRLLTVRPARLLTVRPARLKVWTGALALVGAIAFFASPALAASFAAPTQEPAGHAARPAPEHGAAQSDHPAEAETGHQEPSIWGFVGKIVNFVLLIGTLVYFLRAPLSTYLANRRTQVRADLDAAEGMKRSAAEQIAQMDAKLKALPRELDELRARGQAEIAAEEQRIRDVAEAERVRLVEQASREIEQQVRMAQRALVEHAADLAVAVAEKKITRDITTDDQARLVDSYLDQVKAHE
jgi:F-type H+-transporting ATPase subunit b